jgi:hypothetical protein
LQQEILHLTVDLALGLLVTRALAVCHIITLPAVASQCKLLQRPEL